MSKEAIIEKILSDANIEKENTLTQARDNAAHIVEKAKEEKDKAIKDAVSKATAALPEILRRKLSVAELESKKNILAVKQEIISSVFDKAIENLIALPKKEYLSLIKGMILTAMEDGDSVIVGKEGIVDKDFVESIGNEKGITLIYKGVGDFVGGVILKGKGCDKNMSFALEMSALREEIEPTIAKILFN